MLVSTLVSNIKRLTQTSDPSITTDQVTIDIINFLNNRLFDLWRSWNWPWLFTAITIPTTIGQQDYSLPATIGDIIALQVGNNPSLKQMSVKEYFDWSLNQQIDPVTGLATVPANGDITSYVKLGLDTNGNMKVRFWRPPSLAVTVVGFGKTRITAHTVADIAAGIPINTFPPETHPVLQDLVASDVYEVAGQKQISELNETQGFKKIEDLKAQLAIGQDDDQTTAPPDYWRWRHRRRGNGTTVV